MRFVCLPAVLIAALTLAGCSWNDSPEPVYEGYQSTAGPAAAANTVEKAPAAAAQPTPAAQPAPTAQPMVTPVEGLTGKVSSANSNLRFVVLTFPLGQMAKVDQRLNVYRAGLKVGELLVTGPQRDDSIVADITAGEAQAGDEVRDK